MNKTIKIFSLCLLIGFNFNTEAASIEQDSIKFKVTSSKETKYFFKLGTRKEISKVDKLIKKFDSLSLLSKAKKTKFMLTKSAYVINKPVGMFDQEFVTNEKFIKHMLGEQIVKKESDKIFSILVPGKDSHTYKMKNQVDTDGISTSGNSNVLGALEAVKKMDELSLGAYSVTIREYYDYSKFIKGGVVLTSYIPLVENKTVVIEYRLFAIENKFADSKIIKSHFINEIEAQKTLYNEYVE